MKNERKKKSRKCSLRSKCKASINPDRIVNFNDTSGMSQQPKKRRKQKILPPKQDKEMYVKEAEAFGQTLAKAFEDPIAKRLFCPEFKYEPCACLQRYIISEGNFEETEKKLYQLLELLTEAKYLSQQKCYNIAEVHTNQKRSSSYIGVGNGHKRSLEFENFVIEKRKYLRKEIGLCERATQKVLMYSNNFLHKRLKTEPEKIRIERSKGIAARGLLKPIEELVNEACCTNSCVRMVSSYSSLLKQWRERAATGQAEARRVIAEMLSTSDRLSTNCFKFITLVTGCSKSTISKVNKQILRTNGDKEPPVHGLRLWKQEQGKLIANSCKQDYESDIFFETSLAPPVAQIPLMSVILRDEISNQMQDPRKKKLSTANSLLEQGKCENAQLIQLDVTLALENKEALPVISQTEVPFPSEEQMPLLEEQDLMTKCFRAVQNQDNDK